MTSKRIPIVSSLFKMAEKNKSMILGVGGEGQGGRRKDEG
jgi:hypothetical protein